MRKILTLVSLLSVISFNASALDISDISATVGVAANSAVYGASAKETNRNQSNVIKTVKKESGVFTDSHASGFIELNVGEFVSLGLEHTPDSISTPTVDRTTNLNRTTTVSVDFNDLNIAYLKLNTPFGVYVKAGIVETDVDVKESMAKGATSGVASTYNNVSTEGTIVGVGFARAIGDTPASIRLEGSYMQLDDVTSSNGVSPTGGTLANGGRNQVDASNLEGLNAKIALTFTLGK